MEHLWCYFSHLNPDHRTLLLHMQDFSEHVHVHTDFEHDVLFSNVSTKESQTALTHYGLDGLHIQDLVKNCHTLQTGFYGQTFYENG